LVAVPAYSLISCSDSTGVDPLDDLEVADCLENEANATSITSNHGHTLAVSKADIDAAVEKTYSIQGTSGHDHTIVVSTTDFETLKTSKSLVVESTRDNSHTHNVTVTCA